MKGVVFTEFLEMVYQKFGIEMVNALIENNDLSSDGVYSAVGTYHHSEMCLWSLTRKAQRDRHSRFVEGVWGLLVPNLQNRVSGDVCQCHQWV